MCNVFEHCCVPIWKSGSGAEVCTCIQLMEKKDLGMWGVWDGLTWEFLFLSFSYPPHFETQFFKATSFFTPHSLRWHVWLCFGNLASYFDLHFWANWCRNCYWTIINISCLQSAAILIGKQSQRLLPLTLPSQSAYRLLTKQRKKCISSSLSQFFYTINNNKYVELQKQF